MATRRSQPQESRQSTRSAETEPRWQDVVVPDVVRREARKFLSIGQYVHVTDFVKQLVGFGSRRYDRTMRIEALGDFWELKEKGGVLGRINVRIYFAFVEANNQVILLSAYKKEDDGAAPPHIILRLRNRLRAYHRGDFDKGSIVHKWRRADQETSLE